MSDPFIVRYVGNFTSIRLTDQNNQYHEKIATYDAIRMARDNALDLVCFNPPTSNELAFCKLIDFNKWKYEAEKKKKKASKVSRKEVKEIRLSPGIGQHDIEHKMKQANEFLDEGDDVVLVMKMRGREKIYFKEAEERMNQIIGICNGHGKEVGRKKGEGIIVVRMSKC